MSKLMLSSVVMQAIGVCLWIVACIVKAENGISDGWVDAAVLVQAVGLLPILVESKIEERRAK